MTAAILLLPHDAPEDAARVQLTQGLFALVDPADVQALIRYKWSAHRTAHENGMFWYARAYVGGRRLMMHTLLTGWTRTDHINGNGLDNRRANLRASDRSQNMANRRKVVPGSSRFKGVSWFGKSQRWKAQIGLGGKRCYLGLFDGEEDAARAYDEAARTCFGEFAALNFPRPGERSAFSRGSVA